MKQTAKTMGYAAGAKRHLLYAHADAGEKEKREIDYLISAVEQAVQANVAGVLPSLAGALSTACVLAPRLKRVSARENLTYAIRDMAAFQGAVDVFR